MKPAVRTPLGFQFCPERGEPWRTRYACFFLSVAPSINVSAPGCPKCTRPPSGKTATNRLDPEEEGRTSNGTFGIVERREICVPENLRSSFIELRPRFLPPITHKNNQRPITRLSRAEVRRTSAIQCRLQQYLLPTKTTDASETDDVDGAALRPVLGHLPATPATPVAYDPCNPH